MLKAERSGRKYPRGKRWREIVARLRSKSHACEVCHDGLWLRLEGYLRWRWLGTVDHILSERWIRRFAKGRDPHDEKNNLIVICKECHGHKTAADRHLFGGDRISFIQHLQQEGWNMDRVEQALRFYGC